MKTLAVCPSRSSDAANVRLHAAERFQQLCSGIEWLGCFKLSLTSILLYSSSDRYKGSQVSREVTGSCTCM